MSVECGECERDARAGHDQTCSRWTPDAEWLAAQLRALFSSNTHGVAEIVNHWSYDDECSQFVIKTSGGREFDVVVRERD
jgi:hypothetical protein